MSILDAHTSSTSDETSQPHRWLDAIEVVGLASSGVGVAIAYFMQQFLLAAVPLTITLSLGFVNRQRYQRYIQQQNATNVAQIHDSVQSLPDPVDLDPLLQKIVRLEQSDRACLDRLDTLDRQLRVKAKTEQVGALRETLTLLRQDLTRLSATVDRQLQWEEEMQLQFSRLEQQLETTFQHPPEDVRRVENAVALLHHELAEMRDRFIAYNDTNLQPLQSSLAGLQAQLETLVDRFDPLERQHRDAVRRLFPRLIAAINELRENLNISRSEQPESPQLRPLTPPTIAPPNLKNNLRDRVALRQQQWQPQRQNNGRS